MEKPLKEHTSRDLKLYEAIAKYKWEEMDDQEEYQCRKCGNDKYYPTTKNPFDRKCSNHDCKHIESVTAHTPFHRLRIPIGKAMDILEHLRQDCSDYNGWFYDMPVFYQIQFAVGNSRDKKFPVRMSSEKFSKKIGLPQRTIYLFIYRFASLIPKIDRMNGAPPPGSWFRGVEAKNHDVYSNLYNLMVMSKDLDDVIRFSIQGN